MDKVLVKQTKHLNESAGAVRKRKWGLAPQHGAGLFSKAHDCIAVQYCTNQRCVVNALPNGKRNRHSTWSWHGRLGFVGSLGVQTVFLQLLPGAALPGLSEHGQGVSCGHNGSNRESQPWCALATSYKLHRCKGCGWDPATHSLPLAQSCPEHNYVFGHVQNNDEINSNFYVESTNSLFMRSYYCYSCCNCYYSCFF